MSESEKSRLLHNMHSMISFLYEYQNVNCSEIVNIFVLLICILYIFSTMNMDWFYNN